MPSDILSVDDLVDATIIKGGGSAEHIGLRGTFTFECYGADGVLKWADTIHNLVVTVGINYVLECALAASALTTVGPFLGLISSVGYSAIVAGDTMSSHGGWTEAGATNAPTYTAPRKTMVFTAAAAGVKVLSPALAYTMTGTGTIKGAFVATGTGAVSTIDSTAGTLLSAGLFSGGDKAVVATDVVNVSWQLAG